MTIRDVFREQALFAAATPERLRDLLARLSIKEGDIDVLSEAMRTSSVLTDLEKRLVEMDRELRIAQADCDHRDGDPLFREQAGFARARETAQIHEGRKLEIYLRSRASVKRVVADFYVNVRIAAESDARIASLLRDLEPRRYREAAAHSTS